jgi:hypothetical protein
MVQLKNHHDLEQLIHKYTTKHQKKKNATKLAHTFVFSLALVIVLTFGTLSAIGGSLEGAEMATGMVVYTGYAVAQASSDVPVAYNAIRSSPDLTKIKLFMYTTWIIAVLVGTVYVHEKEIANRK